MTTDRATDTGNVATADVRELDPAARAHCIAEGWSLKDGSLTIRPLAMNGRRDLATAVKSLDRNSETPIAVRRHIQKRAKAISAEQLLPATWKANA